MVTHATYGHTYFIMNEREVTSLVFDTVKKLRDRHGLSSGVLEFLQRLLALPLAQYKA